MNIALIISEHLLHSLVDVAANEPWKQAVFTWYIYFPLFIILLPVIGFSVGYLGASHSRLFNFIREHCTFFIICFGIGTAAGFGMLYFTQMKPVYCVSFTACIFLFLFIVGFKLAVIVKGKRWILLYSLVVVVLFIGTYLISGAPTLRKISLQSSKSNLRNTFIDASGRKPNQEEKRNFWKGAVGEERPSELKKNEHWKGQ